MQKIISGAQTGADRGGLDAALALGIAHGGFVPRGRRAEDGCVPSHYDVQELATQGYLDRTRRNVEEADGTVVFTRGALRSGSLRTVQFAEQLRKPCLHVNLAAEKDPTALVHDWLVANNIGVLNVAGSRLSTAPGIDGQVRQLLVSAIGGA